jgi:hypothetical protein
MCCYAGGDWGVVGGGGLGHCVGWRGESVDFGFVLLSVHSIE